MNKKELQMAKIKLYYKEFKCYMMKKVGKLKVFLYLTTIES